MTMIRTLLCGLMIWCLPGLAVANCTDLRTALISGAQAADINLIQRGLRTALGDDNALLSDNRLGAYTRVRLVAFCQAFPLPTNIDQVDGTLTLAADYGRLAADVPDWKILTSSNDFAAAILPTDDSPFNMGIMRLIGPAGTTAQMLLGDLQSAECDDLAVLAAPAQAGQLVLNGLDPDIWPDATATCSQLHGTSDTVQNLEQIGLIEAGLPGSINQLLAPDFGLWLGEDISTRGPRLVGNADAIIALVAEYRAENRAAAPRDFSTIYQNLPPSCDHGAGERVTDFISFDQAAFDGLVAPVDVNSLLGDLEGQSFDSADALTAAVKTLLAGQVSVCTMDQVLLALTSPENFGKAYALNAEKTANLALDQDFAENAALVAPFVGLSSTSRGGLLAAIRGALQTATQDQINAQVEAAAGVLASAAEPVADTFDTPVADVPEFAQLPVNPTIGVTLNTDSAIEASVPDTQFRQALLDADYQPAPNAEVLKSDARRILGPIADTKVAAVVNRAMVQLQPAVDTSWGLTDTLSAAIAAAPATQGVPDAAQTADITKGLTELIGIEYPTARLFDAAIEPFASGGVANDIRASAAQSAPNPTADFNTNLALPDCGCTNRREDNALVYSFMPFWMAAVEGEETADTEDPTGRLIDFGIVNRAAFYGLEFTVANNGSLILHNEAQWTSGRRDFVRATHRHRAKADLAITLTGWENWSVANFSDALHEIEDIAAPFSRTDSMEYSDLLAAFPTILDPAQVDGITLIVKGYDGTDPDLHNIDQLVLFIKMLKSALSEQGQTLNLAFDLNIGATRGNISIFGDIAEVLTGTDPIVDYILIFLERRTSDSKKILRARMENGAFRGVERARILRRIVPVLPPAAHENVRQSPADNADPNDPPAERFSQFEDDLVYFQDNFAGVGFWPAPDPFGPETERITQIFEATWFAQTMPAFLTSFEDEADQACTFICPNRAYFAAAILLIFITTALVIWRSFYSGFMDRLAFTFGLAWIGSGLVFAGLLALTICDSGALLPPLLLAVMICATVLLILFYIYQGAKNGPKP